MKRNDITGILTTLNEVSELKGVKFAFAVLKNRKKIEVQIEEDKLIFEQILKPSEGYTEFETKRIDLCIKHSEKDEDGNAITENEQYKILDMDKFHEDLNILSEEYKDDVKIRYEQIEEYNSLMEEDLTFDFKKVPFEDLPTDISEKQLRNLEFMLILD